MSVETERSGVEVFTQIWGYRDGCWVITSVLARGEVAARVDAQVAAPMDAPLTAPVNAVADLGVLAAERGAAS